MSEWSAGQRHLDPEELVTHTLRIYQAQLFCWVGGKRGSLCLAGVRSGPEFRSELDKFIHGVFKVSTPNRKARNGKNVSHYG